MRFGTGARVFVGASLLIATVVLVSGSWLSGVLREQLETRIEAELRRHLLAARELIQITPTMEGILDVDPVANRLGQAMQVRVTVIEEFGRVLGDSNIQTSQVHLMENHADRPECSIARETGDIGIARRYSNTIKTEMLYAAMVYERDDSRGFIRVAMPLSEVQEYLQELRKTLWIAGLLALALGTFIGGLFSHFVSRTLRELILNARVLTEGALSTRNFDAPGDVGTLADSITDMSRHLDKLMHTLARERDRFRAVLEGMEEGVIAVDSARRVTMLNESARQLFRFASDALGLPLDDICSVPELKELVNQPKGGHATTREFELDTTPVKTVLARVTPLAGSKGAVVVVHNVTEMRRLEMVRRDFVANVSHELRTPVSVIHANSETLLDGALDDEKQAPKFVEAIYRNSARLGHLVADLLDLSRIEAGQYDLELEPIKLYGAGARATEAISIAAAKKNMDVFNEVPGELVALADMQALDQVLLNLVENAVKYTPENGRVIVRAFPVEDQVRIEVMDDGPGIPAEHHDRLFERFYRVDPGRSKQMGGTGLGLAIVKHLVNTMGGTVGMTPGRTTGSVFWVELPREA